MPPTRNIWSILLTQPREILRLVGYRSCSRELDVHYELHAMECIIRNHELTTTTDTIQKCFSKLG